MTQHSSACRRRFGSSLGALAVLVGTVLHGAPAEASSQAPPLPVPYSLLAGSAAELVAPDASPPGANDFGCRPSAAHPRPVVLLHGFLFNRGNSWATAAPLLRNNGYCVFALTYGTLPRLDPTRTLGGLDYIESSTRQLSAFVDQVLAATGADKVDLVGWSEGGWLGRQYIQFAGGDTTVDRYVGLAPANGPTTFSQLVFAFGRLSPVTAALVRFDAAALTQVVPLVGQAFNLDLYNTLNAGGGTSPHVTYTNIATRYDELVPPAAAFVPTGAQVTNVVLQDGCPIDLVDHLGIVADRRAMGYLLNALDPARRVPPPCTLTLPVIG